MLRARARRSGAPGARRGRQPAAADEQLDPALHDRVLAEALAAAAARGRAAASDVTPFLLERFHRETGGASPAGQRPRSSLRNAALAARDRRAARGVTRSSSSAT